MSITVTPDLDVTAARLAALEDQQAAIAEQITALRAVLANAVPAGGTIAVAGRTRWRVSPGKRTFSERLAGEQLPAELLERITVAKVDGAALKRISPALWEECCTVGAPFLASVKQ